jgi:hypothetical protein
MHLETCVIITLVSIVEQSKHQEEVATRIYGLVQEHKPGALAMPLREFAREELERSYPREALLDDFERVRSLLEAQDHDDEEDDVVTVMDALSLAGARRVPSFRAGLPGSVRRAAVEGGG